ncbi:MAG: alanine--tRNA ligase, partial [Acidobacteriota bacterium]|nr:alanine--tRNA ligase [Acidobacteriota bacterium]
MNGRDIRQSYLDFFVERGHRLTASAPLVPQSDPTLLFVNAGMVPFKNYFLGEETPPSPRATSAQKCLRVSGKHNDLENVGPSHRHQTFFEMLGNFSFGDYFKAEAIEFAWDLVVGVWGLDPEHLYATVYEQDDEAYELWVKISSLPPERVVRCGKKDNFWSMGDTGPCGPCSELHIDRFPDQPAVDWGTGSDSGRYFEFWNLVFMQFDCNEDGVLTPLPNPSIDTGCGFERIASVLQGVGSNYQTDVFQPILAHAGELARVPYGGSDESGDVSLRVIADHVRAVGFLLADGIIPSNEGRGYVLRRILRRAVRHGMRLGLEEPFLHDLLPTLAKTMNTYTELEATREASAATVLAEEEKFLSTVAAGAGHVQAAIDRARSEGRTSLAGEEAFRLYDTHGLPVEMIREILEEEALTVDEVGFDAALGAQRQRSRSAASRSQGDLASQRRALTGGEELAATGFSGYDYVRDTGGRIVGAAREDADGGLEAVDALSAGETGVVALDRTVFYAESGGQVGDTGSLVSANGRAEVVDTQKDAGIYLHRIEIVEGSLRVGDEIEQDVDSRRRRSTERNHTATHLLHAALRAQLGTRVRQAGSLVHPDRLRFDYTHDRPLRLTQREAIEDQVLEWIRSAVGTEIVEKSYDEAIAGGAMALFGEKYGDRVRTVTVPGSSVELCGGCHVRNTGEIGGFRIVGERGVASGVRRIEAVTGEAVESLSRSEHHVLADVREQLAVGETRIVEEIADLKARLRDTQRELKSLRLKQLTGGDDETSSGESRVDGVKVLFREVPGTPFDELRTLADVLRQRLGSGVVVVGASTDDRVSLV